MAPPTNKPRLRDLDPSAVALDVARTAIDRLASIQIGLYGMLDWTPNAPEPERTEIYRSVRTLAHYAIHGGPLDAPVQEYLISLIPLYSAVLGEGTRDVDGMVADADPDTELGLVIAAAMARSELAAGRPVTLAQLAALAGLSWRQVWALTKSGELAADDGKVSAAEARRWLSARGVPGIEAKARKAKIGAVLRSAEIDDEPVTAAEERAAAKARKEVARGDTVPHDRAKKELLGADPVGDMIASAQRNSGLSAEDAEALAVSETRAARKERKKGIRR